MAFNQFLGLGSGFGGGSSVGGGGRGPKGDPGSFIWSFGNPPNVDKHFTLGDDDVTLYKNIVPISHDTVDIGDTQVRFKDIYTRSANTDSVRYSNGSVEVSYTSTGEHSIKVGDDYTVFGVTTLKNNPDKIDPKYIDFTGLRFVDVIEGSQNLETLKSQRPLLQPGDYFVVKSEGNLNYDQFDEIDNVASRGDIIVFTLERFFKVPFRIPNNAISTFHISDGSITAPKLANDCVQPHHIQDGSVTASKLVDTLDLKNLSVSRNFTARTFCVNEEETDVDPMENQHFGITFADNGVVKTGTWRIRSSIDSLLFEIWNGSRWVNKFELR